MHEDIIKEFWSKNPCGDAMVGGLQERFAGQYAEFFADYDEFRYTTEQHILECLDEIVFSGKRVLEIGLGQGSESEQIIRRGGIWSGIDLTAEAVARVSTRLAVRDLPYEAIKQGTACDIAFPSDTFEIVFSHGVLHHVPDIRAAQREIARVLKPGGILVVMVYAKNSLNYLFSIFVARRLGLLAMYLAGVKAKGIYGQHLKLAADEGILEYLKMRNFIHRNTDGPLNPYSKVYNVAELRRDFEDFDVVCAGKRFTHAPPLPVRGALLQKWLGWHLWAQLRVRK